MKLILLFLITTLSSLVLAATPQVNEQPKPAEESLENQVKALDLDNRAPSIISREKFYSVQDRYLPLKFKSEISAGFGQNLTSDSFLQSQQMELAYRFHIDNRWSLGLAYSFVANQFSDAGLRLMSTEGVVPDVAYARHRSDLTAEYNIFYGKFRLSMDQVLYFDMYGALGGGTMELSNGNQSAVVGDLGFVFWLGKWGSARFGLKDYYYDEIHRSNTTASHNLHAHLDVGYLF